MKFLRAQASAEYAMVMAAMLVILIILMAIFMGIYSQQSSRAQYAYAQHTLSVLATAAKDVWIQGNGSEQKFLLDIPDSADLARSSIINKTMKLYISQYGDAFEVLPFNVSGAWPSQTGAFYASVFNNGTQVLIRPAGMLQINTTGLYFSSSGSRAIKYENKANVSYRIEHVLACSFCSFTTSSFDLAPGASQTRALSASVSSGIHSGYLQITAYPLETSDLPKETFILPITGIPA